MSEAIPWLPLSALADARTAEPVARALGEWSAAWLAAGSLLAPPRWEGCEAAAGIPAGYNSASESGSYRLLVRADATFDLAALLLGREIGERECRTPHDRAVIEHLVAVAIRALAERLGDVLRAADTPTGEWFVLPICWEGGATLLRLEARRPVLAALAADWAGPLRRTPPLSPRRSSLASHPLRLSARVGTNRLALAEIEALEVGDVLLLDTPLTEPVDARIDDAPAGDAALSLVPGEDHFKLQIERPAAQW